MEKKVIFDLGSHKGEDSDFYLKKGFRVVAVDASDELSEKISQKFSEYLKRGDFAIYNYAVTEKDDEIITFYQNTGKSVWGTIFDTWDLRNSRLGTTSIKKDVKTIRLDTLIKKELQDDETLEYIKIDIEGADLIALRSLANSKQKPRFVSIESEKLSWDNLIEEFNVFKQLGYSKFKLVDQSKIQNQKCPQPSKEGEYVDYQFQQGCSGLFGDELPGEWLSAEEAINAYKKIFLKYKYFGDYGIFNVSRHFKNRYLTKLMHICLPHVGWYDTHASF
jgi:FkbM family methyltransferase